MAEEVKFPELRRELLKMEAEDQDEIISNSFAISQIKSKALRDKKYCAIAKHAH